MGNDHFGAKVASAPRGLTTGAVRSQLLHNPQPLQRRVIFKREEGSDHVAADELQQRLLKNPKYIPVNIVLNTNHNHVAPGKPENHHPQHHSDDHPRGEVAPGQQLQVPKKNSKEREQPSGKPSQQNHNQHINEHNQHKQQQQPKQLGPSELVSLGFVPPQQILCKKDGIEKLLKWPQPRKIGPGLNNLGNTCFLNSVLQCLTYTPPLAQYFLTGDHSRHCKIPGFCMMCELETHVNRCFEASNGRTLSPNNIVHKLRNIAKHMRFGRQEDAHEFTRYVIEGLQKSCLGNLGEYKLDNRSKETSLVHQIFGGYLQSQVKCHVCKHESNVFDPLLDLSLDLKGCQTLEKALQMFTSPEILSGQNKYRCERCKKLVDATKQFTIFQAPNVLTIQLKRFDFMGSYGGKIGRFIPYPEKINLKPHMSKRHLGYSSPVYRLYGVLVHSGHALHSGHYFAYVKNSTGTWYDMNDSFVREVGANTALQQPAYMLFYVLDLSETQRLSGISVAPQPSQQQKTTSPDQPPKKEPLTNGHTAPQKEKEKEKSTGGDLTNGKHANGHDANGKHINGKDTNGKHTNGKLTNGVNGVNGGHPTPKENGTVKPQLNGLQFSLEPKNTTPTATPTVTECGWKVTDAQMLPSINGVKSSKWTVTDLPTEEPVTNGHKRPREHTNGTNGTNGTGHANGKMMNGKKTVNMPRAVELDDDMRSFEDSDEEESAASTEEEYEDHFSGEEEEDDRPAPKKPKIEAKVNNAPVVLKWDEKKERKPENGTAADKGKKADWEKTMRHEQYDKQIPNWENPSWNVLNERKDILKSGSLSYIPEKLDDMDREYDEGRKKKSKKSKSKGFQGANFFQRNQDLRNKFKHQSMQSWK